MEYDLHIHSRYSFDSRMEPRKIIDVARRQGLAGIAIVDHDSVGGGLEGASICPADFVVIPGMERHTVRGDIIGLFVKEAVTDTYDPAEVIQAIHEQGGLALLPHPTRSQLATMEPELLGRLDLFEGFNARRHRDGPRAAGGVSWVAETARRYGKGTTGGSDAHFYGEIGSGRTVIPAATLDEAKAALLRGNLICTGRPSSRIFQVMSMLLGQFGARKPALPDGPDLH